MSGSTYQEQWSAPGLRAPRAGGFMARCCDVIVAIVVLVGTAPIAVAAACAVKLSSRGPVLVREARRGEGGRRFEMLAFRTTHVDGDRAGRSTAVGHVLVASSIAELPRWWNVVRGDLAIVGPPPAKANAASGPNGMSSDRGTVRPGLTGIWRESGR